MAKDKRVQIPCVLQSDMTDVAASGLVELAAGAYGFLELQTVELREDGHRGLETIVLTRADALALAHGIVEHYENKV